MKVSIRLQNHGCSNHPYWWIVVAPNRKNIRGRFLEHVGYWAPRQGVTVQRSIILNLPRIKHWIACGAVPTFKVQKFLSLWGVLPKPWYWQRTPEELAAMKKPESEWTDKDKIKEERKRKRRERQKLSPLNYFAPMAKFKALQYYQYHKYRLKLREKIFAAQKQNQILRQLLLHNQFHKINRINQLSGNVVYDDSQQLLRLQKQLTQAKAELALVQKNFGSINPVQKIHVMQHINKLVDKIRDVEMERQPFRKRNSVVPEEGEHITSFQLDKKLQYELIVKKLQKMNQDFQNLDRLMDTVTLQEYANYLQKQQPDLDATQALQLAQQLFIERGSAGSPPMTKFDLYYQKELGNDKIDLIQFDNKYNEHVSEDVDELPKSAEQMEQDQILDKVHQQNLVKFLMAKTSVLVPTNRPVHPFPDLQTYIPEQYYEPINNINLQMMPFGSLQPKDELDKYHLKRQYASKPKFIPPVKPKVKKPAKKQKRSDAVL